jgi:hypothetical protein
VLGDGELIERLQSALARDSRTNAVELEGQSDVFEGRQPGEEVEVLEDVADRAASHFRLVRARDRREVDAVHEYLTAARFLEAAGDCQEGAFAGAARAHDRDELVALDPEIDLAERVHLRRSRAVGLRYVA